MVFDANRDYSEAAIPDIWRIFGIALNPFCEGHRILLARIGSPFVTGEPIKGLDLALMLMICSRDYSSGCKFVSRSTLSAKTRFLSRLIAFCEALNPIWIRARIKASIQYIEESERLPKGILRKQTSPDGKPIELTYAPNALILFDLCHHFGWSVDYVLNMPLRAATMARYRLLEIDKLIRWRPAYYDAPPVKEQEATNGK